MQSFRTLLESPGTSDKAVVEKDIIDLGNKIAAFKDGNIHEDKFRALRLARGVYGQRQPGVQMIRIKLPFGKVTTQQLRRISDVSDEYSTGHLHITTRQDIQIHYVSLDRTPQLWEDLERDDITLREACGNTVRNVTASAIAGIDPNEPFDVAPYADLLFRYFLRKPFGQELGRKIKIAFSSSDDDDAFTFIHDFGFIPKIQSLAGETIHGFKVVVGGGLGAQPILANVAYEFLPANEIIPFVEASIRIFERYGERNSRNKARMKYLIAKIGFEKFLELVNEERIAVQYDEEADFQLFHQQEVVPAIESTLSLKDVLASNSDPRFQEWLKTNVIAQKQSGYYGVFIKVQLGNFNTTQARQLADIIDQYAGKDIRFTIDQSILFKFVQAENLVKLYEALKGIQLADSGYNSLVDVTACPGTDTCNLGISNSTDVSVVIEQTLRDEYPQSVFDQNIKIKISGCMNSCGQHGLAHIGFHGSSMKVDKLTAPALQVLLGGGKTGNGHGRVAEKVIKVPSKRVLDVLRYTLNDFLTKHDTEETFNEYYDRVGNKYFYDLLKPLADTSTLQPIDFIDWGQEENFKTAIGVGECAGVMLDLVSTLIFDAEEKLGFATEALTDQRFADALFHSYAGAVHAAKALLLDSKVHCNTQQGILIDFDKHFGEAFGYSEEASFEQFVLSYKNEAANERLAIRYFGQINDFVNKIKLYRSGNV